MKDLMKALAVSIIFIIAIAIVAMWLARGDTPKTQCSLFYINAEKQIISVEDCALDYDIEIKIDGVVYDIKGVKNENE